MLIADSAFDINLLKSLHHTLKPSFVAPRSPPSESAIVRRTTRCYGSCRSRNSTSRASSIEYDTNESSGRRQEEMQECRRLAKRQLGEFGFLLVCVCVLKYMRFPTPQLYYKDYNGILCACSLFKYWQPPEPSRRKAAAAMQVLLKSCPVFRDDLFVHLDLIELDFIQLTLNQH